MVPVGVRGLANGSLVALGLGCCLRHRLDERGFGMLVGLAVGGVALRQHALQVRIRPSGGGMRPEMVAEQQMPTHGGALGPADVEVVPFLARRPTERLAPRDAAVALMHVAQGSKELDRPRQVFASNHKVEIDDGFGGEPRHCRAADVLDGDGQPAQSRLRALGQDAEALRPPRVIVAGANSFGLIGSIARHGHNPSNRLPEWRVQMRVYSGSLCLEGTLADSDKDHLVHHPILPADRWLAASGDAAAAAKRQSELLSTLKARKVADWVLKAVEKKRDGLKK